MPHVAPTGVQTSLPRWITPLAVAVLLGLHAVLALTATAEKSTTVDEMAHLTAGHAMWTKGDFRLQPENGVLPQLWEALPAVVQGLELPPAGNPGWSKPNVWTLGHVYFHQMGHDLGMLLRNGRAMNLCWSVLTGLVVFGWARHLFGTAGGLVALGLWAFCPTFLAHGALATSDMCMTFFMLVAVTLYGRHLAEYRVQTLVASAVATGLAFTAKYSAVLLPVMFAVLATIHLMTSPRRGHGSGGQQQAGWRDVVLSTFVHALVAVLLIWAFHRFRFLPAADGMLQDYTRPWSVVLQSLGRPLGPLLAWARDLRVLPDAYLYGFGFVVDLSRARGAFLNGETSLTGWAMFFPYAFLVKTPPALLIAVMITGVLALHRALAAGWDKSRRVAITLAPLLVLFVVYWAFSLTSTLNIGQRHLLPTYPVLFILAGYLGRLAVEGPRLWRVGIGVLLAGQVASSVMIRPHYLAYFNALAGGPSEGYRHLVDSSLDWGQDLPGLARWLREPGNVGPQERVYLAYFGTGDPEYHGIRATPMVPLLRTMPDQPWHRLSGGVYCISTTLLQQTYSPVRGEWTLALEREFQDLRATEPALIDYYTQPARRREWEASIPAEKWPAMWKRYEELRFARLCYVLRAREPDAQIGYSINVYRLSEDDIAAATGEMKRWVEAIEAASQLRPTSE